MGNWLADDNDDIVFQGFRNDARDANYEKMCLFGLSGSGKSTLYLNLRQMYSDDSDQKYDHPKELKHCEAVIRSNCLLYIAVLVNEAEKLYLKTRSDLYHIDYKDKGIKDAIELVTKYIPFKFDECTPPKPMPKPAKIKKRKLKMTSSIPSALSIVNETTRIAGENKTLVSFEFGGSIPTEQQTLESTFLTSFNIENFESGQFDQFEKVESKQQTIDDEDGSYVAVDMLKQKAVENNENKMEEEEITNTQNVAFMMSQYDDYALYDDVGFDLFQMKDWKTKYNDNGKQTKQKCVIEPYKSFNFDEFAEKHKAWKLKQEQLKKNEDGMKYFDDLENEYKDEWGYTVARGAKQRKLTMNEEELIDDFGVHCNKNKTKKEIKPWKKFGHKAALLSKHFGMKLNDKQNPIKHNEIWAASYESGALSMEKVDNLLGDTTKFMKLSKYESESSDDDDYVENEKTIILTKEEKELRYKIEIIDGKIQKYKEWDTDMMSNKRNVLKEMVINNFAIRPKVHSNVIDENDEKYEIEEEKLSQDDVVKVNGIDISIDQFWSDMKKLGHSIKKIWNLPAIKQTYFQRYNLFCLPSNIEYFFYHSPKIFDVNFHATNQCLSLYRSYKTMIQSFKWSSPHGQRVHVFDIPATTKALRDKYWNPEYCANCDVIIFFASLVAPFNVSFEDPAKNAFYASMELFYELLHARWLNKGCQIVLFLTHKDQLIEYIRKGYSIKTFHSHFKEWKWRPSGDSNVQNKEEEKSDSKTSSEKSKTTIDKTIITNTIDRMQNNFDQLMLTIQSTENKDENVLSVSRKYSAENKERSELGTITKFMPELSEDIELLSDDDAPENVQLKVFLSSTSHGDNYHYKVSEEEEEEMKSIQIEIKKENVGTQIQIKSPAGNVLQKVICVNGADHFCDRCRRDFMDGDNRYECRMDDYDLCQKCYDELSAKNAKKSPVWILDEYKAVEFMDRFKTPKSDFERRLETDTKESKERDDSNDQKMAITPMHNEEATQQQNKILSQFKKQTKKKEKMRNNKKGRNENWKYILSGDQKLTYDGSEFDDDRWAMEAFEGHCEWMRKMYYKCKDVEDDRIFHCHVLNLVNQDDIDKVMNDLDNYVFGSIIQDGFAAAGLLI